VGEGLGHSASTERAEEEGEEARIDVQEEGFGLRDATGVIAFWRQERERELRQQARAALRQRGARDAEDRAARVDPQRRHGHAYTCRNARGKRRRWW
jgi:hypothetical protein